jgi:hypothetical protein
MKNQPIPRSFIFMLAAWNETDPDKIRKHLDRSLADNVIFADPENYVEGKDAFEQMVKDFRTKTPNARCERTSGIDSHHDRFRYEWAVLDGDKLLVPGFDVVQVNENGLVERIDGFFGPFPPLEK